MAIQNTYGTLNMYIHVHVHTLFYIYYDVEGFSCFVLQEDRRLLFELFSLLSNESTSIDRYRELVSISYQH